MSEDQLQSAPGAPGEGVPAPEDASARDQAEAAAWAEVVAAWDDEQAHRAYLARPLDLEGLAVAGGRYRAVLDARPDDAMARRFRDEVVQRATVAGLALMPRTTPRSALPRLARLVALGVVLGLALTIVLLLGSRVLHLLRESSP